ncbi:MAG: ArsR family transcriptional regulator [Clostridiales bacterium]|nr:ArsR family transcriptional regulator [Clostridiales bacterium]
MNYSEHILNILALSDSPLKSSEISDLSGIDKGIIDKALKDLKKQEKIDSPKRCYYQEK